MVRYKLPFPELLYPYSPVAKPMPVPPVTNVCEGDLVCVQFSCALIPYLLGLLEVYRYKDSFKGTDEEKTIAVGVMRELMEVLAMACCGNNDGLPPDVRRRINPITGMPEVSTDGGVTWVDDPSSVYSQATVAAPLQGADGAVKKCEAANNVIENLQDLQAKYSSLIGQVNVLQDLIVEIIVAAVAILLVPVAAPALIPLIVGLIPVVINMARSLLQTTQAAYDAMFTIAVWNEVRCILLCHMSPQGTFTREQYSAIKNDLRNNLGSEYNQAGANLASMIEVWQVVGLNNAARIGSGQEGNCDDCDDCGCAVEVTFDGQNWLDYGVNYGSQQGGNLLVVPHEFPLGSGYGSEMTIDMGTTCAIATVAAQVNLTNNRPDHSVSLYADIQDENHEVLLSFSYDTAELAVGTDYVLSWNFEANEARYVMIRVAWLDNYGSPNSGYIDWVKVNPE